MSDYISKFDGQTIDDMIQKTKDINKTAGSINNNLDFIDKTESNINNAKIGEVLSKSSDGTLEGTGIINEQNKIFFPKDGRFPSGSIDVGPCITLSENGGWLQNKSDTLGKNYLMLDYEIDSSGSKRPIYWERAAQENNVVINQGNQTTMNDVTTFSHVPVANSQVNALYFHLASPVTNLRIEIFSLTTNKPIKYIPNENAWKNNTGGLDLTSGVNDVLQSGTITPISLLTTYNLRFNLVADTPINVMGDGVHPYIAVDRQLITAKGLMLQGEGTGSADTPELIRDKLTQLQGENRLDAAAIKNIPSGSGGSSTLLGLTDTPDSYTGKAGTLVRVNAAENGIEFDNPPDFALPDLSNVTNDDLKKASVKAGMLQQDLEDIQLPKLKEKVIAAGANLITVGELHGDYHEGDVKEIDFHNGMDVTIDAQNKIASISLSPDMGELPIKVNSMNDEITRIKTDITLDNSVFSYRGNKVPIFSKVAKQYYINITSAGTGFNIKLPTDAPNNAILLIRNSDKVNTFTVSIDIGTINNLNQPYTIQNNGLALFIKNTTLNWNAIYSGYMPNNLKQLLAIIKTELPDNTGLTISQIQAQLKDRLHLFSEIGEEFKDELHTFDAIEANMVTRGFSKGFSVGYGMLDTGTPPLDGSWVVAYINPSSEVIIPSTNKGMKYLAVYMPTFLASVVDSLTINGTETEFTESDVVQNENYYKVLIAKTQVDTSRNTRLKLEFKPSQVTNEITFLDGLKGTEFMAEKVKSSDKSIRIAETVDGFADITRGKTDFNEGIHVCLGQDEIINSKFGKTRLYFSDTKVKGGMFVYPEMATKSFVLNDTDPQDDPNISGGSTYIVGLYYTPNDDIDNTLTQDGSVLIELCDDSENVILDTDKNAMAVKIDYKSGDKLKEELYLGECAIKVSTKVHLKITPQFQNEELISVGANTQICLQSVEKDNSSGLALLSFMAYTGYSIRTNTKYYGYNSMNLASRLIFDTGEVNTGISELNLGENLYLNFKANSKLSVQSNRLLIKDDGVTMPIWSIVKTYDSLDSKYIGGKMYKVTATITDKDCAFDVGLFQYTGNAFPVPKPSLLSYQNTVPTFTTGWNKLDEMNIDTNVVVGEHTQSKTFTLPKNAKSLAIMMYPRQSMLPCTIKLKDLEGDITPWFTKTIITDNSHIREQSMLTDETIYRSIVKTPSGVSAYRYTANIADTKVPIGVISGNSNKIINDNSWVDAGSIDPNKTQGDLKFLADGHVKMFYMARCFNEQGSNNNITFWLAKNVGGVFTEVAGSKTVTTIEGTRVLPKMVTSLEFEFDVKANETYRMFMKANKDDGFYLQSNLDGVPLFRTDIIFDEFTFAEKEIFDKTNEIRFVDNGQEVTNKVLQYDVGTGRMTVIDK